MQKYSIKIMADQIKNVIPIPPEFEHKELRVIISPLKKRSFDPLKFRGIGNMDRETIDRVLNKIKDEWDSV